MQHEKFLKKKCHNFERQEKNQVSKKKNMVRYIAIICLQLWWLMLSLQREISMLIKLGSMDSSVNIIRRQSQWWPLIRSNLTWIYLFKYTVTQWLRLMFCINKRSFDYIPWLLIVLDTGFLMKSRKVIALLFSS